jgi:hypothetical protein
MPFISDWPFARKSISQKSELTDQPSFWTRTVIDDALVHIRREMGTVVMCLNRSVRIVRIDMKPA